MTLEKKLKEAWKRVRERFFYPNLPDPKLSETRTASINMFNHQIEISPEFVNKFVDKGVPVEEALDGLLSHEVGHYLIHPYDLAKALWLGIVAERIDNKYGETANSIYSDLVVNLNLIMRKDLKEIPKLLRAEEKENPIQKIVKGYYQEATGIDMGVKLDDYMKQQVKRLQTIDFLDATKDERNLSRFTKIIRDIMLKYQLQPTQAGGMGNFNPNAYDKNELERALRDVAAKCSKEEFDKLVKKHNIKEKLQGKPQGSKLQDITAGTEDGETELRDVLYFQVLAENFRPEIKKRKLEKNGSMFPHTHKEFEVEDSPRDIDVYASLGKPFLPGLGKTWVKAEGTYHAEEEHLPNLLIMKDISGSMQECEPYAEIACIATADAYLEDRANVAVYLFNNYVDRDELKKGYQEDRDAIHRALTKSNSGGTVIDKRALRYLDFIIKKSKTPVDIVLVTDLDIDGREELFEFLYNRTDRNRVTIVYTGKNGGISDLQERFNSPNFTIYSITSPEQIPDIVIGEVRK
ncbi:hypothetical protein KY330_04020 [Candidatus Woesearchaeota archaeon]|nr:hypothetical protein [Candidatus Woesearchaeota archaeon]